MSSTGDQPEEPLPNAHTPNGYYDDGEYFIRGSTANAWVSADTSDVIDVEDHR